MNPKIFKGRTVEEATEEALKTLNEDLENLEIKIIDTGRNGILGLGGHPAEIEVYVLGAPNASEICLLYTSPSPRDGLLSRMPSSA